MVIKKENRLFLLKLLQRRLDENKIDLRGLGADSLDSPYRNFCPCCDCRGILPPEEETWNWHTHHVNNCLQDSLQTFDFLERREDLVTKEKANGLVRKKNKCEKNC